MEPQDIFELIIKADEKLKYAHEDTSASGPAGPRPARAGARGRAEIGNDALVQQADTRLSDLENAEPAG